MGKMLQFTIQYLNENPELREKVKNGEAVMDGLSHMEHHALVDVLRNNTVAPQFYWN